MSCLYILNIHICKWDNLYIYLYIVGNNLNLLSILVMKINYVYHNEYNVKNKA